MSRFSTCTFLVLVSCALTNGLDNGLALTPPMGWMHWERYRCLVDCHLYPEECISENLFKKTADAMVSEGYLDAGYEYVMIDDCWMDFERDPHNKRLRPNATRFPNGIKSLADYIHDKGLKLGIYADFGTKTCGGYPGSIDHLELDAMTFAEWEVDYLKLDGCYANVTDMEKGYSLMSTYLNETGRPIVYSCSWPAYMEPDNIKPNYTALAEHCNLWRNWDDIDDSWQSVSSILKWFGKNQERIVPFAGPGHWNDPDMLIIGNYGLSYEQAKSQMALWAILAAPLIMSVDLINIEPAFKDILLHRDIININQDRLGIQGRLQTTKNNIEIWSRPITPVTEEGYHTHAIAFLSLRADGYPYRLSVNLTELALDHPRGYYIKDIYNPTNSSLILTPSKDLIVRVKPSGVVFLIASPIDEEENVEIITL